MTIPGGTFFVTWYSTNNVLTRLNLTERWGEVKPTAPSNTWFATHVQCKSWIKAEFK